MGISDDIKSGFYAGIGMMLKGKEKLEDAAREFIKDKNVSAEEGEKFVKDMVNKASETKEEVTQFIDDRVKQVIDKMGYVKKEEYESMRKELDELKASINKDQEKKMKMMTNMSIIFISIASFTISTGVALYWIFNSVFTVVQNLLAKRGKKNANII